MVIMECDEMAGEIVSLRFVMFGWFAGYAVACIDDMRRVCGKVMRLAFVMTG